MAHPARQIIRGDSLLVLFDRFLAYCKEHRSPATYRWYREYLQKFIATIPAAMTVEDLRPFHVQQWADSTSGLTAHGRRGRIRSVQRALHWGRQQGYITPDPISSLKKPQGDPRSVVISPEEYSRILALVPEGDPFRDLLTLAWETGARPQELAIRSARHVEMEHARWVIPRQEAKGKKRPRVVYLTATAEAITRKLVALTPESPLLRNADGMPWKKDAINCRFKRLKDKLGAKYCLYHFRHSFATRMLKNGADPLTVAEWMGHSDPTMLARVYQHLAHDPQHMLNKLRSVS